MKILVIGANGRTGSEIVAEALTREYEVIAFVKGDYSSPTEKVKILKGDAMNPEIMRKAVKGVDVIISAIGHTKNSPAQLQTVVTDNILNSIEKASKEIRFISLTGSGVRVSGDKITVLDRILNLVIKIIDPARVSDGINHYKLLSKSRLRWTVVRVLKLTNGSRKNYNLDECGPVKTLVSRKTVARAMVDLAGSNQWTNKAPLISR